MTAAAAPLLDTRDMTVVHAAFRREFRLAGALVRRVADGDAARAAVVSAHLDLLEQTLHHHHSGEDALLWPKLEARVADELRPLVALMDAQHAHVAGLLARIGCSRPAWAAAPTAEAGAELAAAYDELYAALAEHLDAEESRLLPLVARCVTAAEWRELGETARRETPRARAALVLGMLQYRADPEVFAGMLAGAPPPVRWLLPRLAARAFRRHALAVHGTTTP